MHDYKISYTGKVSFVMCTPSKAVMLLGLLSLLLKYQQTYLAILGTTTL